MALVELAQYTDAKIAVLLGVPPPLVGLPTAGDSLTYNTALMALDQHWRIGLRPTATAVMAGLSEWLLPRGTTVELNSDNYVQPEPLDAGADRRDLQPDRRTPDRQARPVRRRDPGGGTVGRPDGRDRRGPGAGAMSDPVAAQLPAPGQQAQSAPYPLAGSLTPGIEVHVHVGGRVRVHRHLQQDEPRRLPGRPKPDDGIDGFVNPTVHRRRCPRRRVGTSMKGGSR